jgi:glycosyltransferase involved in cell wall biosynthesis
MGTRVVFLQADTLHSPLYQVADAVVVPSRELARLLGTVCPAPITTIEDALELPREISVAPSERERDLRLLWVGNRQNLGGLDLLRPVLDQPEFRDLRLVTVSNHPEATFPWSPDVVIRELQRADAGILPCEDSPAARAKSNNRLTLFMGVGLPVAASPLPAYREVVDHGRNGLLARTTDEWADALRSLRDPSHRRRLGEEGRRAVWERFSPRAMGDRWERLLRELAGRSRPEGCRPAP